MSLIEQIRQVDWQDEDKRKIAETLVADAKEYIKRVEAHIYKGNEIRADMWMDYAEKQDEIRILDRRRTEAHNKMLASFNPFLDLVRDVPGFKESDYKLANRTQIADFVASIVFELLGSDPVSRLEGDVRDELAEKLHKKEITYEQIDRLVHGLASE